MNQRVAVDAFQCRADAQRRLAFHVRKEGGGFDDEEGAQPLAAVQHAVAHGGEQAFGAGDLVRLRAGREQRRQQRLDRFGISLQAGLEFLVTFAHRRSLAWVSIRGNGKDGMAAKNRGQALVFDEPGRYEGATTQGWAPAFGHRTGNTGRDGQFADRGR